MLSYGYSYLLTAFIYFTLFPDIKLIIPFVTLFIINILLYQLESFSHKKQLSYAKHKFYCLLNPIINIFIILILSVIYIDNGSSFTINHYFSRGLISLNISLLTLFRYTLALLIAGNPSNHIIKNLLASYQPKGKKKDEQIQIGAFIGTLERIIVLLMFSINQFAAAGLVFTAKSIARYNEIAENKAFAEYYLLGTLLSLLFALGINYIIL